MHQGQTTLSNFFRVRESCSITGTMIRPPIALLVVNCQLASMNIRQCTSPFASLDLTKDRGREQPLALRHENSWIHGKVDDEVVRGTDVNHCATSVEVKATAEIPSSCCTSSPGRFMSSHLLSGMVGASALFTRPDSADMLNWH